MWYAIQNDQILYQGNKRYTVLHEVMQRTGGTKQKGSSVKKIIDDCYLYQYQNDLIYVGRRNGLEQVGFSFPQEEWEQAAVSVVSVPTMKTAFIIEAGNVVCFSKDIPTAKQKVVELKSDTRKYPRFTREENGIWRYIPQTPRTKKTHIYIATLKTFNQSEYAEIVSQYRRMYYALIIRRS